MKKRIWASLDDYLPPETGSGVYGRMVVNHNFFKALLRHGHFDEYHFFLHSPAHQRLFTERQGPTLNSMAAGAKVRLFLRTDLARMLRDHDYVVFHQSDYIRNFNALCHFRNRNGSFPVTAFIHSLSYPSLAEKHLEMMYGGVTEGDAILCSSTAGRMVLCQFFNQLSRKLHLPPPPVALEVIPFGLESEEFDKIDRGWAREKMGFKPQEVVGLCLGRFSEYDKMDLFPLLQAYQKIYRKENPWRIVLAGSVQSQDYVRMVELWAKALGIGDSVILKANLSENEKITLYKAADFFISPSDNLQETFGMTLVEAMAAELPLIVSDFDGYRDIATPDVSRRIPTRWADLNLFAPGGFGPLLDEAILHRFWAQSVILDIDGLSTALKEFFSQPGLCREMGRKAKRRFDENYTARGVVNRLESLWSQGKEAFSTSMVREQKDGLFPDFFQAFSHYFSETLSPDAKVRRTEFAAHLREIGSAYPLLADMQAVIEREKIEKILLLTEREKTIEEILTLESGEADKTHYQILWMIKHGLLEVV